MSGSIATLRSVFQKRRTLRIFDLRDITLRRKLIERDITLSDEKIENQCIRSIFSASRRKRFRSAYAPLTHRSSKKQNLY